MKIIYRMVLISVLLVISTVLIVRIPAVQTYLASKITGYVYQKTGFKAEIKYINIKWFDEIVIEGVSVIDRQDSLMASIGSLNADLDFKALVNGSGIVLNEISIVSGELHLMKHADTPDINLTSFLKLIGGSKSKNSDDKSAKGVNIGEIKLSGIGLYYDNFDKTSFDISIDPSHLRLDSINGHVIGFKVSSDTILGNIKYLNCQFSGGLLDLKNLSTDFQFTSKAISMKKLNLETAKSKLDGDFIFSFDSVSAFKNPLQEIELSAEISNGVVDFRELSFFTNIPSNLQRTDLKISGSLSGPVSRLKGSDIKLEFGELMSFEADFYTSGLPLIQETFLDINFNNSYLNLDKLIDLTERDSLTVPEALRNINYVGQFTGFISDFVAKGQFMTEAGNLKTDLNLKINDYPTTTSYKGLVSTKLFDLGKVLGDTVLFQKIALEGSLRGVGVTQQSADFFLKSKIDKLGIKGYEYSGITTDGEFKSQFFNGKLRVYDPNVQLSIDGRIDMSNDKEEIKALIEIDSTNLKNLKLTNKNFVVSTKSDLELNGFGIDRVTGFVKMYDFELVYDSDTIHLSDVLLNVKEVNNDKIISIRSEEVNVDVNGDFKISTVVQDLNKLGEELLLQLTNDREGSLAYYKKKEEQIQDDYSLQFSLELSKPNVYLKPFVKDFFLSDKIELYGGFNQGEKTNLSINVLLDSAYYQKNAIVNAFAIVNISKESSNDRVTSHVELYSDDQYWNNNIRTQKLESVLAWENDKIDFKLKANPPDSANTLDISGVIDFIGDTTSLRFDSSKIKLDNHVFEFNKSNNITKIKNGDSFKVIIDDLILSDGSQSIAINGYWEEVVNLVFTIKQVDVFNISALIGRKLNGIANGRIVFNQEKSGSYFTGDLLIDSLLLDDFLVGDLMASTEWDAQQQKILMDFNITREGVNSVKLIGDIELKNGEKILDIDATFDGAQISLLEPYLKGIASDIAGDVNGRLDLKGTLDYPVISGDASISNGAITIDYLKSRYTYSGKMKFIQDKISLDDITLTDFKGNKGFAKGEIVHNGFKDLLININANLLNFNVLNTNSKDNKLFYGEAYVSGKLDFYGTPENIKISANAKTNKNTRIFIPLSEEAASDVKDYITFFDFSDSTNNKIFEKTEANLKGIELDFNLDVTPDAYFELIFDINSGDIIRGRGEGDIKLAVSTEGDFSMFGDYQIKEGGYNFTLYNIINKEFSINPGSRITWYGDPYQAILDIEAKYSQFVPIEPIINQGETSTRVSTIVKLFLKGPMLSPEINFDIDFEDYPAQYGIYIDAFKSDIRTDQQELNRQVFSLLILKKLINEGQGFAVAANDIGASVSEFVSNQLSYWITQVDENLEIDVDISTLDEDAFNTFQLRLSYKFLDGRLRVSRGGGFGSVNQEGSLDANKVGSIIGDLTIEYLLTPDGRMRIKMFTRNSRNALGNSNVFETGASFRYVRSFDYLKEIWKKNQVKKVKYIDKDGNEVIK